MYIRRSVYVLCAAGRIILESEAKCGKCVHYDISCTSTLFFVLNSLLFPLRGGRTQALAFECKTVKADFTDESTSYHLISWRKSSLNQNSSKQIKVFKICMEC